MESEISTKISEIITDSGTVILDDSSSPISDKYSLINRYADEMDNLDPGNFDIQVSDGAMQKHVAYFDDLFKNYVNSNSKKMYVSGVIKGEFQDFQITPYEFVKNFVIQSAVFLGPDKTGKLLSDWISGNESLSYDYKYYIRDLELESTPLLQNEGEIIEFHSAEYENFDMRHDIDVLEYKNIEIGVGTIVSFRKTVKNVFHKNKLKQNESDTDHYDIKCFFECLSLVMNSQVPLNCRWRFDRDLYTFFPNKTLTYGDVSLVHPNPIVISDENCAKTIEILPNYRNLLLQSRFGNSVEKMLKSRHSKTDDDGRLIYLRIAFEALLTPGGRSGNISLKLATIVSRFLRESYSERYELYELIRIFYEVASEVVHGTPYKEGTIDIDKIQDVWNEVAIKILESGTIPEWKEIILG